MNYYTTKPKIIFVPETDDGYVFGLARSITYKWRGKTLKVPKGFTSDGASVPRLLWASVSPTIHPYTIAAAIMHDYIYRTHPEGWSRWDADLAFAEIAHADGLSKFKTLKAWIGLRLFGWIAWKQKKKEGVE